MKTKEEMIGELNALYAKATAEEEYARAYKCAVSYYRQASDAGESFQALAGILLPGYWAEYYRLKKFPRKDEAKQKQEINLLASQADQYYRQLPKEDIELKLNYGYLLSVILNELKRNPEEARKVDAEIQGLIKGTGRVAIAFKVINPQGLTAMQKKDWPAAIAIFSQVEQNFQEVSGILGGWQNFANIINNRGLSKLNLSDETDSLQEKRGLISSGIVDLWNAEGLYMKVVPPPLKHIDGIQNRLIVAAYRLLLTEGSEEAKIGRNIKEAFEAKDREEAKRLIFGLGGLETKTWEKIEGIVPGDTMTFIESIQVGLHMADEFLEKHKEGKQ